MYSSHTSIELKFSHQEEWTTDNGSIIHFKFKGIYPPGSQGNPTASQMIEYIEKVLTNYNCIGVIFNLLELNYIYGDAICGIVKPLWTDKGITPSCIIAKGKTAMAIEPLLGSHFLLGLAGCKLFRSYEDGIYYLKSLTIST